MRLRRARRTSVAVLAALLGLAIACNLTLRTHILAPLDGSAFGPEDGDEIVLEIDLAMPLGFTGTGDHAQLRIALLAGIDDVPVPVDLTDRYDTGGSVITGAIPTDLLAEGRNTLFVSVDREGDGIVEETLASTFSWEPSLDLVDAAICDPLDAAHCLLPLPNDFFTVDDVSSDTGRRVSIDPEATPSNVDGVPVDPSEWNRNDGFSPGAMIVTQVPGIDLERTGAAPITDIERSLESDAPIVLIDSGSLTNGTPRQHPIWAELDQGSESPETDSLTIRSGVNLANGERYVVALRDLRDASGDLLEPGRAFEVYRDRIPTFRNEIEERRPQMEEIFDILERAGIERERLYLAWDFTVISKRNMSERMLEMRDDAFASLAGAAPAFAVSEVLAQPTAQLYRQVEGTYRVPLYLNDDGVPGSRLTRSDPEDPDSLPVRVGDFTARFLCIIPNAVLSEQKGGGLVADPGRPSLYGHGLLGSRSETRSGHNRDFADEYGFVSCGTDWIGMAEEDVPNIAANILRDFSHFPEIPDRLQQAYLNFLFLGRLLLHEDGFASHCAFQAVEWAPEGEEQCPVSGEPVFDRSEVFYDGNSQGALAGGALAAFAQDWTRFVLGVAGMNYSTLLRRSVDFDAFDILLSASYPNRLDAQISIALAQMLWDRADTSGHASHLTSDTYPDTPRKKILLHVAFGDHQVANVSAEIEARTMGAHIHQPALATGRHSDVDPYWGIPAIDADPFAGSAMVIWDSGTATPPTDNVPSREGQDPHETPRRDPKAKLQKSEFLKTGGAIIDVCEGVPCTAVDP